VVAPAESAARIMVIDDDAALLKFTSKYLSRLGYSVSSFDNAGPAWSEFSSGGTNYSLVVLDVSMEELAGNKISRMVLEASPEVRLILTSGYPYDVEKLLEPGRPRRVAFLHKPFTPAMLADTVARLLQVASQGQC